MSLRSSTGRSNAASVSRSCGAESVARLADRRALCVDRAHHARGDAAARCAAPSPSSSPRHFRPRPAPAAGSAPPSKIVSVRSPMVLPRPSRNSAPRPVSTPSDSQAISASPVAFRKRSIAGRRFDALDRIGFWRELAQRDARGAGRHQRDVARGLRQRHQRHAAAVVVGIGDQFVGGLDPGVPARGRAPAVVEQDHQRRAAAADAGLRIPDRAGGGENDQRRGGKPQQRSATTACATGFLPSARCRTTAASAETRCAAAAAASPAAATTAPAGSTGPAAAAVRRR